MMMMMMMLRAIYRLPSSSGSMYVDCDILQISWLFRKFTDYLGDV